MRGNCIVWAIVVCLTIAGGTALADPIFSEDFNGLNIDDGGGTQAGGQADTGLPLYWGATLPGWTVYGAGPPFHAVGDGSGDWALQVLNWDGLFPTGVLSGDNVATLETGIAANSSGVSYAVSFEAGPSVFGGVNQMTLDGNQILIELLNPSDELVASHTYAPGEWAGEQTFAPDSFLYTGDGTGDVRFRISPYAEGPGIRFYGAITNLEVSEVPEPGTLVLAAIGAVGLLLATRRRRRQTA